MPAVSAKQKRFMSAELGRMKAGKKPKTGMSEKQLAEFASGPVIPKREHRERFLGAETKRRLLK